jgi:hypothetical protein
VPSEVKPERGAALAMRWLIAHSRKRNGKSMVEKLSAELVDASNGVGSSVKKEKIHIKWLKLTELLHITDTNWECKGQLWLESLN